MIALALVTAALAIGHADRNPTAVHGGIAFARHSNYADTFVDWHGHVRPYDGIAEWSPHGRYVALPYTECANGSCESWFVVKHADGSHRHVLQDAGSSISWAADESTLAYIDAFGSLEVANGDGARIRQLDVAVAGRLDQPTLSPDGRTIAFTADGLLYTVPVSGRAATPLGVSVCPQRPELAWSGDGGVLAFVDGTCNTLQARYLGGLAVLSVPYRGPYAFANVGEILAYTTERGVSLEVHGDTWRTIAGASSPSWQPGTHNRLAVELGGWVALVDPPNARPQRLYRGSAPAWTTHGIAYAVPRCGPRQGIWLAGRRLTNVWEVDGTHGTQWPDEVWSVNHKRERVTCGAGHDIAHVDARDVVAPDCEVVRRPARS